MKTEQQFKKEGYDEAIDMICNQLRQQIEQLHKAARDATRVDLRDNYKYGVELFKHLIEQLKSAKAAPEVQKFTAEEIRALVDHLTGTTQSLNNATMSYFDESVLPMYMAGTLELKQFTISKLKKKDEHEV